LTCFTCKSSSPDYSDDIPLRVNYFVPFLFTTKWRPNRGKEMWCFPSQGNGSPGYIQVLHIVRTFRCELHGKLLTDLPAAFMSALIVGCALHYKKIVENEHYGYPQEWFPSVSATIGDRYPERSFFMFFIAITSGRTFNVQLSNCV